MFDGLNAEGTYEVKCISADGTTRWEVTSPNLVTIGGANLMLDCAFTGTLTGPSYASLITSNNFGAINQNDTLLAKAWLESSCYTGPRPAVSWHSANSAKKVWSKPLTFSIASNDTVTGAFLVFGSQANNTVLGTNGVLWSASTFGNGNQFVMPGDTVVVQYQTQLLRLQSAIQILQVLISETGHAAATMTSPGSMNFIQESLNAVDTKTVRGTWISSAFEAGSASATQVATLTMALETSERLDALALPVPHFTYVMSQSETGSSTATQDSTLFARHETGTAAETQVGTRTTPVSRSETISPPAHELQIPHMTYAVTVAETGTAVATNVPHVTYQTFSIDNVVVWSDISDGVMGQYLLDDSGNFITDDAGNRIIID